MVRLFRFFFSIYGLALFVAILLVLFPLVVLASLWGKTKGGNVIYWCCKRWSDVILPCWGIHHRTRYEVPHDRQQSYVFVFNHLSYIDIPLLLKVIRYQHFRILGKSEMTKVPIFGFLYKQTVVLVDRSSAAKRAASVLQLKSIIRKGISVVIAPEGTFNTTHQPLKSFYDGAFRVAIETQTPIKPILFLDAYDRMPYEYLFSLNPGKSRAVYLEPIDVAGLTLQDLPQLRDTVYRIMEEKLLHYQASWIRPSDVKPQ